jgi:hypothetical protein
VLSHKHIAPCPPARVPRRRVATACSRFGVQTRPTLRSRAVPLPRPSLPLHSSSRERQPDLHRPRRRARLWFVG